MAKFIYPFQKILDYKENEKEFAQIQMAQAISMQKESLRKIQEIYQKIIEAENEKNQRQQDGVNIFELRMHELYINQLKEQLMSAERELEQMESQVAKTQGHLQVKVQEEKTWSNLKKQKLSQFEHQAKAAEQAYFDELAASRYYRASAAERG